MPSNIALNPSPGFLSVEICLTVHDYDSVVDKEVIPSLEIPTMQASTSCSCALSCRSTLAPPSEKPPATSNHTGKISPSLCVMMF